MNIPAELDKAKTTETRIIGEATVEASKLKTLWHDYKAEIIGVLAVAVAIALIVFIVIKASHA